MSKPRGVRNRGMCVCVYLCYRKVLYGGGGALVVDVESGVRDRAKTVAGGPTGNDHC